MRRLIKAAALTGLAIPAAALGDTVRLRSGDVVEGGVKDLGDRIEVAAKDGPVSIRWRDVEVVLTDKTPADVYREKLAATPKDDANALFALAMWAGRAGMPGERADCLKAALKADPEHAGARSALGEQKSGDQWLEGAALLRAKGFVGRDGVWVLAEEAALRDRRAEAAKGFLAPEKRADELLQKAASGTESARKFALDALAGLGAEAVQRPALRALRRGDPAVRELAARALGKVGDVDVLRPLLTAAILDREPLVRAAAVDSLKTIGAPESIRPLAKAMWSSVPDVRMNAVEALASVGGVASVEWVIRRVQSTGGPGGRNHFFSGTQLSYISDFDVEIAQAAQIGDPIVGTLREGVLLDARVIGVREEWTEVERRVFYGALARATGKDFGQDAVAWKKWFDTEGRVAMGGTAAR